MLPSMYPGFEKRNRILGGQLRLPDSIDDFNFPLERFIVKGSFDESFRYRADDPVQVDDY